MCDVCGQGQAKERRRLQYDSRRNFGGFAGIRKITYSMYSYIEYVLLVCTRTLLLVYSYCTVVYILILVHTLYILILCLGLPAAGAGMGLGGERAQQRRQ